MGTNIKTIKIVFKTNRKRKRRLAIDNWRAAHANDVMRVSQFKALITVYCL